MCSTTSSSFEVCTVHRGLGVAASRIGGDRRDSVQQALQKKMELLNSLWKEAEAQQEKKLAQGIKALLT